MTSAQAIASLASCSFRNISIFKEVSLIESLRHVSLLDCSHLSKLE